MTECERILEKGILPSSFCEAEIISDYYVDEKRKKIWAIELDLFIALCDVCRKHNLKFWADGGTMLGAVRHKGFIPWDDDMDIIMPRSDYNKLLEIGPAEFGSPIFCKRHIRIVTMVILLQSCVILTQLVFHQFL